jgi:chromosome segregation ATPase
MDSGRLGRFGSTFAFLGSVAAIAAVAFAPGARAGAILAAVLAALAGIISLRTGAHARAGRRILEGALKRAGIADLADIDRALAMGRPSERQLVALGRAIDETLERHERLTRALRAETEIAATLADTAGAAFVDVGEPSALATILARNVDGSAAAAQHASVSLAEIRGRIGDIARAVHAMGSEIGILAISIHQSGARLQEARAAVNDAESASRAAERTIGQLTGTTRVLAGDIATIRREVEITGRTADRLSPSIECATQAAMARAESGRQVARGAECAFAEAHATAARAAKLVARAASSAQDEAAHATALMREIEQMNDLVRHASQCFDDYDALNESLAATSEGMRRLGMAFVDSVGRRRTAYERIDKAARRLASARKASGDASAGIDEIVQGLKARLGTIVDELYVATCTESASDGYSRLAAGRANSHPSAGR